MRRVIVWCATIRGCPSELAQASVCWLACYCAGADRMTIGEPGPAARLIDSVRESSALLLGLLGTRIALLSHEVDIEATRIRSSAVLLVGAMICLALAIMLLVLLVIAIFWETHRLAAIGGSSAVLLVAAAGLAWASRQRMAANPRPFATTLQELAADCAALRGENGK